MDTQSGLIESYKRFVAWQCRLRKKSARELGGRPTAGMSAGVYSISGGEEKGRINFLIVKRDSNFLNSELKHIVRKTQDTSERLKNGLRILSERHYQDDFNFSDQLTALFQAFEQKNRLVRIVNACISQEEFGTRVTIGLEDHFPGGRDFSLVSSSYKWGAAGTGTLGVLGPRRMEYEKAISVVDHLGKLCCQLMVLGGSRGALGGE